MARPAVAKGIEIGMEMRSKTSLADDIDAQKILFGQTANK